MAPGVHATLARHDGRAHTRSVGGTELEWVKALYAYASATENLVAALDDQEYVRNGTAAFAHMIHPDYEFVLVRDEVGEQGAYRGVDGFFAGMREWLSTWETYRIEAEEIIDLGDAALVLTVDRGRSKRAGLPMEQRAAVIHRFRDGLIARSETYMRRDTAFAAAGLAGRGSG